MKHDSCAPRRIQLIKRALRRLAVQRISYAIKRECRYQPMFCLPRDLIGTEIVAGGAFEEEFLVTVGQLVHELKAQKNTPPSAAEVALDIGANIGSHALYFAGLFDRVICFEPNPPIFLVCQANAILNSCNNIEVLPIALSNEPGTATLYSPDPDNTGGSTLEKANGNSTKVSVETGDSVIAARLKAGERVALIKVDVEGHEPKVFQGLKATLATHRPIVLFESHSTAALSRNLEILKACGYGKFRYLHRNWAGGGSSVRRLLMLLLRSPKVEIREIDLTANRFYHMAVALP